ncbi:MAG: PKD domain-containing protein [Anaerolineae bacterium]
MFEEKEGITWRWFALVTVACLLVVCILFLDGQLVRAAPLAQAPGNSAADSGAGVTSPAAILQIDVNYGHDWVAGATDLGEPVMVTVTTSSSLYKDGATVTADGATGEFFVDCEDWYSGWCPDIVPGDHVQVQASGLTADVDPVGSITGQADESADTVTGTLNADGLPNPADVSCEVWEEGGPAISTTANPGGGSFTCDFTGQWDLQRGDQVALRYYETDGDSVINILVWPSTRVNYAQDWVGVDYLAGHTFVVTVTNSTESFVKGVAEFETTSGGGWSGPGYETSDEDWISLRPDIDTYDWVHFASDDGYRHSVQVGAISASVSAPLDEASGYLYVGELAVECQPWGGPEDAPTKETTAPTDLSAPFACEWDPATEWDVLPGQDVAVMYIEPDDGDRIINVLHDAAPDLQVEKWVEGSGEVQYDGLSVWGIRIRNEGDGPAPTVVLTDILPLNTAYLLDSSGLAPDDNGDHVVWTFDAEPLQPGDLIQFLLVLDNNLPAPDAELFNEVWAWAEFDINPDDNNAGAGAWATDVAPGMLHIGKDPSPGDPAAGSTFAYYINYGNHEAGATGPVVLTDTIPGGTSLVGWYSQNGYPLWVDASTPDQLILEAPVLPGYWDDTIVLRLRVDPALEPGTQLTNTAEIDWPAGHESALRDDVWVGEPYWDVGIDKNFGWGALVPGGEVEYHTQVNNQGNMTATVRLTDTLQPGVAYGLESSCHDGQQSFECPLISVGVSQYAIDVGEIPPGGTVDVTVRWGIYNDSTPDVEFGNCVEAGVAEGDQNPYDNTACSEPQTIRDWGPNLRVRKEHSWDQEGSALHYDLYLGNVGSQALDNLLVTDIYPEGTTFNDSWGVQHGPWITLTHDAPSRELIFWVDRLDPGNTAQIGFDVDLDDPDLRPAWYTNTLEAPVDGDVWPDDNDWQDVAVKTEIQRVELSVNLLPEPSSMWGEAAPGVPLTVTTPYSTVTTYVGDAECESCWSFDSVGRLKPGDAVTVQAGAGLLPVELVVPKPFDVSVDTDADQVSGRIDDLDTYPIEIHGNWDGGYQEVQTDSKGNFLAQYDDIPRGVDGYARFEDEVNYAWIVWHRPFRAMDLIMEVNYGQDWVQGYYEPDHTVWITVTQSDGLTVKGTARLWSQEVPEWGDFVGFSTELDDPWAGERPDIVPGDLVFGEVDNGYTSEVQVGEISGNLDITTETIAGTITAPWPAGTILDAWCSIWVENGPGQDFPVDAGGGAYSCDFSGQWDIQPGQDVAIGYYEPDLDQVINVFYEPVPDLSVNKDVPGPGEVLNDGLSVWHIQIQNEGEAVADTVTLTDTMPAETIYYANSSGLEPVEVGGQLIWDFGPMGPGEGLDFVLVLWSETAPDQTLLNQVDVWAEWDNNPDNNHAEAEVWATDIEPPELGVDKSPEPGDPAPGQTFLYSVNVGNNGPAATGPVTLADTIPDGTSIVDWWTEGDWPWQEVSRNGQLVLETLALPGYGGDTVYLQLLVDGAVELGTQLTNTVEVVSPDSSALAINDDAWVGEPRWEGGVDKSLGWAVLVPGGEVSYNVHVRNQGNMAAGFTMTDTLPVGTIFEGAWLWDGRQGGEIVPAFPEPGVAVFDLGELKPAEFRDVEVRLLLDPDLLPGDELQNCVEINPVGPGDWPGDNEDCAVETVRPEGPNVRIQKDYQWTSEDQLQFYLSFWNLGTTDLDGVQIVDTLPTGTYWVDEWWHDFWEDVGVQVDGDQVTFTLSRLEPGWASGIGFNFNLDAPGVEGEVYTNTVTMPLEGDTFPGDNYDEVTAYTGPGLYVDKSLADGEPRPGAVLTYTIEFGNNNVWPWNTDWLGDDQPSTMLVDLLPEGMSFLTATAPWNPEEGWMPEIAGQELSWGFQPINAGDYWEFQLAAQVSPLAEPGDILTNTVEVLSLSPGDVDPLPDDNSDQVVLEVLAPALTIEKEVSTSAVAGTIASYTLSVENQGNVPATGVTFADTLPDDLTYVDSDGAWDGTIITWIAGELAPFGGTAGGWFSATLTCEADVLVANDTYSVTSNEGATATGATVDVTTIAPTIQLSLASAPDPAFTGETVTLTATASTDGTDLTFEWDFGEGPVSGGLVETNVWDTAGSYTVVVTATDQCGFSEAASIIVTVGTGLTIGKDWTSSQVAGTLVTYTLVVENVGNEPATGVTFADTLPDDLTYVDSDGAWDGTDISWSAGDLAAGGGTASGWFSATLTCEAGVQIANNAYSVTSDQGATTAGAPVAFTTLAPTIQLSLASAPDPGIVDETVTLTVTAITDGTGLSYEWNFGDGPVSGGLVETHVWDAAGSYTVVVTATDQCGFSETVDTTVTIEPSTFYIYLPMVLRQYP